MKVKQRLTWLIVALFLGVVINGALFFGEQRFRSPVDPLLMVAIAAGLYKAILMLGQKRSDR